jgi:hypothetical protein
MVRISFDQKPFRKLMMQVWDGNCVASPSTETNAGRTILEKFPDTPGSLGIAISEAIEQAVTEFRYCDLRGHRTGRHGSNRQDALFAGQCFEPCDAASNDYRPGSQGTVKKCRH